MMTAFARTAFTTAMALLTGAGLAAQSGISALSFGPTVGTLVPGSNLQLEATGQASQVELLWTLNAGTEVQLWRMRNRAARAQGMRLPEPLTVANLTMRYDDGTSEAIAVRVGESISLEERQWWDPTDGFIGPLAFCRPHWVRPLTPGDIRYAVVYEATFPNPRPEKELAGVELRAAAGLEGGKLRVFRIGLNRERPPATRFVHPQGDDSHPGTFDRPWKSLRHAANVLKAGETLWVRGGTFTTEKRVAFVGLVAKEGEQTRVVGWPGETAILDGMGTPWDTSPDRIQMGFEVYPHDQSMLIAHRCERFAFRNLHILNSRARGFGAEVGRHIEVAHCTVFRSYGPGIRFAKLEQSTCIGNTLIRPTSLTMRPADRQNPLSPVLGLDHRAFGQGAPMEGLDCGELTQCRIAYNEIGWTDKECLLVDGDVDGLRIDHNYVHDAYNRPWVWGIAPNGYGEQQNIEIDHNVAHHTGSGFGIGTEGGGFGRNVRIHHNVTWDCVWNGHMLTGAWSNSGATLSEIEVSQNTMYRNGHYDDNPGPAGGIVVTFPTVAGEVSDILVQGNLVEDPRDYALALNQDGDPAAQKVVFRRNLTNLPEPSSKMDGVYRPDWRHFAGEDYLVIPGRLLRDPDRFDFRTRPELGIEDYGAFDANARWVEFGG